MISPLRNSKFIAIAQGEGFETIPAKYRELAVLIRRTETPKPEPEANPS